MKAVDDYIISETLSKARKEKRKRIIYSFHSKDNELQRMLNAGLSNTYVRPHMHKNKDQVEIFFILKGRVAILSFHNDGKLNECQILDDNQRKKIVEIAPLEYHSFVIMSGEAVLYEIKSGPYQQDKDKVFPKWAPEEGSNGGKEYLRELKRRINNYLQ